MPLTNKQLNDVCLLGQGHRSCRYLSPDDQSWGKYHCIKLSVQKKVCDEEAADTRAKMLANGQDVRKQGVPMGDNCSGYPLLRIIDQGYDLNS